MEKHMQSEAYKLTGFTAVISALGFMFRWLQNMKIIEEETGLAVKNAPISALLVVLILAVAAVLIGFLIYFRRYEAPVEPVAALGGHTFLFTIVGVAAALMLAYSGISQVLHAGEQLWPKIHSICGIATVAASLGTLLVVTAASDPNRAAARRIGSAILVLFGCFWLVTVYKDAAADPVIWRFAVEILAVCSALIALYHVAGYYFSEPKPQLTLFFCNFGAFLCIMSAIDEHTTAEAVCYAAVALLLLMWGFVLTENLQKTDRPLKLNGEEDKK